MRQTAVRVGLAFALMGLSSAASAEVMLSAQQQRSYDVPAWAKMVSLSATSTPTGVTVLFGSVGADRDISCGVIVADGEDAKAFRYKHEERTTQCLGVLAHPDGGFFVRGDDPSAVGDDPSGFTAYVDGDGAQRWSVEDVKLRDALSRADGGTGEFIGVYDAAHPAMVYSPTFDRLLGFSQGKLTIGAQEKPLTQAHVINVETGRLTVSGQTFGGNGISIVGGLATRQTDGHFLLYFYSIGDEGAFFYSYNGRSSISSFKPLMESWETRVVRRMTYGPGARVGLLWTPNAMADAETRVTFVDDAGQALWQGQWPSSETTAAGVVELGRPLDMWAGAQHVLVLYRTEQGLYVRVIDINDGVSLGVAPLDGVTPHTPLSILIGESGQLKLLAADADGARFYEYGLEFMDLPDVMPQEDMGPEMGADMGVPALPTLPEVGCGCASASQAPVAELAFLSLGLGLMGWRRRRRR